LIKDSLADGHDTFRLVAEAIHVLILLGSRKKKEVLVIGGFKYYY